MMFKKARSVLGVLIAGLVVCSCAKKPIQIYGHKLPVTNQVTLAACYFQLHVFSQAQQPATSFPKDVQEGNASVIAGVTNALQQAGYQVTFVGCKDPWITDGKSVKVTLKFLVMPAKGHGVVAAAFVVPPGVKGPIASIIGLAISLSSQ